MIIKLFLTSLLVFVISLISTFLEVIANEYRVTNWYYVNAFTLSISSVLTVIFAIAWIWV